jgi:D-glycero-D-manno-heptose 1,7-bisphosphate phosphatase
MGKRLCAAKPWQPMARAAETPFVGDQSADLKAAFRAGRRRVLVEAGLGRKALATGLPAYVAPVSVHPELAAAVQALLPMMC